MRTVITLLMCYCVYAQADTPYWEECGFVYGYSVFAYKMATHEGVPEERFHIEDDDEASAMKKAIRHDVYNDLKSLRERVERACAEKKEN